MLFSSSWSPKESCSKKENKRGVSNLLRSCLSQMQILRYPPMFLHILKIIIPGIKTAPTEADLDNKVCSISLHNDLCTGTPLRWAPISPSAPGPPRTGVCQQPQPMHRHSLPITIHGISPEGKAIQLPALTPSVFIRSFAWNWFVFRTIPKLR